MEQPKKVRPRGGVEAVRNRLVAALHSGLLRPGARAPSVRRLAELLDLDRKTVHRAYREMEAEGLVEIRPGSGTFVADVREAVGGSSSASRLALAVQRARAEAAALGLPPSIFARFLELHLADGLRDLPIAIAECNREQVGLFAAELREQLGIRPRLVLLDELRVDPRRALGGIRGIVTSDFHFAEIATLVREIGPPAIYRVALEPSVPRLFVEHARRGPLIMVVLDRSFAPGFLRFLAGLGTKPEVVARIQVVEPPAANEACRRAGGTGSLYVSPLVEESWGARVPAGLSRIHVSRHLAAASVERLRARLALDVALGTLRPA